jgi:hypothetical protein
MTYITMMRATVTLQQRSYAFILWDFPDKKVPIHQVFIHIHNVAITYSYSLQPDIVAYYLVDLHILSKTTILYSYSLSYSFISKYIFLNIRTYFHFAAKKKTRSLLKPFLDMYVELPIFTYLRICIWYAFAMK